MTPPALDRVVKTCLAKDPDDRWQTAHDVKLQLAWIAEGGSQAGVPAPVVARRKSRERLALTIAAAALLAAAALTWLAVRSAGRPERVFRSSIPAPEGAAFWLAQSTPGPAVLSPDGGKLAFTARDTGGKIQIYVRPLDAAAEYASGHILFLRERTLMVRPFDAGRLAFTADPFPLAEKVLLTSLSAAIAVFSASQNGILVYQTAHGDPTSKLTWHGRDGGAQGVLGEPGDYLQAYLSPGGKHAVAVVRDPGTGNHDLWVFDVARNLRTRFTFGPLNSWRPVWSPDGGSLAFGSNRKGHLDLYRKALGGSSGEGLLYESKTEKSPMSFSPDGRFLAYFEQTKETKGDIWILPLQRERKPQVFLQTPFFEVPYAFSPDGRWLSYGSDESGKFQVYVTSFPRAGRKWQVSTEESAYAHWRADGKELVFEGISGQLWAVEVAGRADDFQIGAQKPLFKIAAISSNGGYDYFPTADHQRSWSSTGASSPICCSTSS